MAAQGVAHGRRQDDPSMVKPTPIPDAGLCPGSQQPRSGIEDRKGGQQQRSTQASMTGAPHLRGQTATDSAAAEAPVPKETRKRRGNRDVGATAGQGTSKRGLLEPQCRNTDSNGNLSLSCTAKNERQGIDQSNAEQQAKVLPTDPRLPLTGLTYLGRAVASGHSCCFRHPSGQS